MDLTLSDAEAQALYRTVEFSLRRLKDCATKHEVNSEIWNRHIAEAKLINSIHAKLFTYVLQQLAKEKANAQ